MADNVKFRRQYGRKSGPDFGRPPGGGVTFFVVKERPTPLDEQFK
jgi:hypothetical protein